METQQSPKLAYSTPSDLVHQLPALSGEQAVTREEGQEIVGTWSVTATPATSWRKLLPREQRDKLRKHRSQGGERPGEETGEQWGSGCDTAAGLIGLGGNPKVCCTGIRAENSLRKKQGPVPTVTFPMPSLTLYIYTPLVGPFPLLDCTLNVYVSLSLWTCVGCYLELDPGFI